MMASAFLISILHLTLLGRRDGRTFAMVSDLAFWVMISGVIGARMAYILANLPEFQAAPLEIFRVDHGGLIFYGGFLGAIAAIIIFARVKKQKIMPFLDFVATALPLGQAFGRIGCLLNGCCYGVPCHLPWSVNIAGAQRHPTQLYETLYCAALYLTLLFCYRRNMKPGRIAALYLFLYPVGRFMIEFLRGDERQQLLGLTVAQAASLLFVAAGLLLWFLSAKTRAADKA